MAAEGSTNKQIAQATVRYPADRGDPPYARVRKLDIDSRAALSGVLEESAVAAAG